MCQWRTLCADWCQQLHLHLYTWLDWAGLSHKCQWLCSTLVSKWSHLRGRDWWLQVSVQILIVFGLFGHPNVNDRKSRDIYCSLPSGLKEFLLLYKLIRNSLYFFFASCLCPRGYTGTYCEDDIDYCVGHSCSEHGVCLDLQYNFTCRCMLGYEGSLCELETNECSSFPCASGATCMDLISDYRCRCSPGFEGMRPSDSNVSLFVAITMASYTGFRFRSRMDFLPALSLLCAAAW